MNNNQKSSLAFIDSRVGATITNKASVLSFLAVIVVFVLYFIALAAPELKATWITLGENLVVITLSSC